MRSTWFAAVMLGSLGSYAEAGTLCTSDFPERPVIARHLEQIDIAAGRYNLQQILDHGEQLFVAKFNACDGQGRPSTTGTGERRIAEQPAFVRTSGPDANSCAACHGEPVRGGSGDVVANVFVLAQALDPVTESVSEQFSNERNTLGMHGSGAIEMLAREMTQELQAQASALPDGTHTLEAKGVRFSIRLANGKVVASEGINTDLVIRPFHQAGVVVSLREFTVNAMNHHHGMQAEERFDLSSAKGFDPDFDQDGIARELTIGDITAVTLWQAALHMPAQVEPMSQDSRESARAGEKLFAASGCTECHTPALRLNDPVFVEPNPLNPAGTFNDSNASVAFDLRTRNYPSTTGGGDGGLLVRAYTDLKRHNLCDPPGPFAIRFYCNERLDQGRPAQGDRPGREFFLTRKLWDVGSSAPYGHRGDLTTLTEAILHHGGEARASRDRFAALPVASQADIVEFLQSLQVPTFAPGRSIADPRGDALRR